MGTTGHRANAADACGMQLPAQTLLVPTLFHAPWWLHAASGGSWEEAEVSHGGRLVARMPYVVRRDSTGFPVCTAPELTDVLGPAVDPGEGKAVTRRLAARSIRKELASRFDAHANLAQRFHEGCEDTFAFTDRGCQVSADLTQVVVPASEQVLWTAMRDKTRNVVRVAEARVPVHDADPAEFAAAYAANLAARGLRNLHLRIAPICTAALGHGGGTLRCTRAEDGSMAAAAFTVHDSRRSWLLLSTRSAATPNGHVAMLVWQALREAAAAGREFDFDGITTPGSRLFYAGFGGEVRPRLSVSRHSFAYRVVRRLVHALPGPGDKAAASGDTV